MNRSAMLEPVVGVTGVSVDDSRLGLCALPPALNGRLGRCLLVALDGDGDPRLLHRGRVPFR